MPETNHIKRWLITTAKIVFGVVIIVLLFRSGAINLSLLAEVLHHPVLLVLAIALVWGGIFLATVRWQLILRAGGIHIGMLTTFRLQMIGMFFSVCLPGSVGGDALRGIYLCRLIAGQRTIGLLSIVIDRLFSLFGLLALAVVLLMLQVNSLPVTAGLSQFLLAVIIGGSLLGLLAYKFLQRYFLLHPRGESLPFVGPYVKKFGDAMAIYERSPLRLIQFLLLSFLTSAMIVGSIVALGESFDFSPGYLTSSIAAALANLSSAIPVTPGGVGVAEAAFSAICKAITKQEYPYATIYLTYRLIATLISLTGCIAYLKSTR